MIDLTACINNLTGGNKIVDPSEISAEEEHDGFRDVLDRILSQAYYGISQKQRTISTL